MSLGQPLLPISALVHQVHTSPQRLIYPNKGLLTLPNGRIGNYSRTEVTIKPKCGNVAAGNGGSTREHSGISDSYFRQALTKHIKSSANSVIATPLLASGNVQADMVFLKLGHQPLMPPRTFANSIRMTAQSSSVVQERSIASTCPRGFS